MGGLAAGVSVARSTVDPTVSASVGGSLTAGGDLTVVAGHEVDPATLQAINHVAGGGPRGAYAVAEAPAIGVFTIDASLSKAESAAGVSARINSGALVNVGGALALRADGINVAKAKSTGFSINLAGAGVMDAKAKAAGNDQASIGDNATVKAGTLLLDGNGVDHAEADDDSTNLSGLFNLRVSVAQTDVTPTVKALVGVGSDLQASGNLTLRAASVTDGDARAHSVAASLGGSFNKVLGTSNDNATVQALVDSSAASPSTLRSGGTLAIQATHGSPASLSDGSIASLDTVQNSLALAQAHGLATGDRVEGHRREGLPPEQGGQGSRRLGLPRRLCPR